MDEIQLLKFVRKTVKNEETGLSSIFKPRNTSHAILSF
jgi:hypothetical protein